MRGMRLRREESRMSAKGYVYMEEKNKSHGPTEEELSDSVKDAYTSVYVLDPMADGFDDEDDFTVEIVGAPSDGENDGKMRTSRSLLPKKQKSRQKKFLILILSIKKVLLY